MLHDQHHDGGRSLVHGFDEGLIQQSGMAQRLRNIG
jgi:hypothetical protein